MYNNHPYLQPCGWIATGATQQDQQNACERRLDGCRQTATHDAGAQHQGQMFLKGSRFWRGRKTHKLGWDRLKLNRGGRGYCWMQRQPDFRFEVKRLLKLKKCLKKRRRELKNKIVLIGRGVARDFEGVSTCKLGESGGIFWRHFPKDISRNEYKVKLRHYKCLFFSGLFIYTVTYHFKMKIDYRYC